MKINIAGSDPQGWDVVNEEGGDRHTLTYTQMVNRTIGDSDPEGSIMSAQEEEVDEDAPPPPKVRKRARRPQRFASQGGQQAARRETMEF